MYGTVYIPCLSQVRAHGVTYMTCLSRVTARNKLLHLTLHPSKQSYNSGTGAVGITSSAATPNEIIRLYISILPFMHGVFFHGNSMYPTMQQMVNCQYYVCIRSTAGHCHEQ